jgi:transcriptional regulator with GAF, ATPase, and Fis domain
MADDAATVEQLRAELRRLRARDVAAQEEVAFLRQKDQVTDQVLRAIAASPVELTQVLDTLGRAAATLGEAERVSVQLRFGDHFLAVDSSTGALVGAGTLIPITRGTFSGRALLDRRLLHVPDWEGMGDEFAEGKAIVRGLAPQDAWRSGVFAPLFKGDEAVGVLVIARSAPRPFTDRQIALFATFADQAVIAIENARLFEELERRNSDLAEALEQQTATAEILRAIATSPKDLNLVLGSLVTSAARVCEADLTNLFRLADGIVLSYAAYDQHGIRWAQDPGTSSGRSCRWGLSEGRPFESSVRFMCRIWLSNPRRSTR